MIKPEIHSVCGSGVHRAVSCSFGEWRGVKFFENGREVGSWVGGAEGVEWRGGRVVVGTEGGVVVFERGEEWKCVEGIEDTAKSPISVTTSSDNTVHLRSSLNLLTLFTSTKTLTPINHIQTCGFCKNDGYWCSGEGFVRRTKFCGDFKDVRFEEGWVTAEDEEGLWVFGGETERTRQLRAPHIKNILN
ncbi:hypothetical protein TL16_g04336 [Triparma laevis f. inornata]|uniref:Uncharacterized protein n=1 Tax=Triparma laevis f. inornata TaxID=1714386 RepID=A0A9W7E541_9STRA|nr:hypothetical protein TL16_g04336 [Triparma laevis f. inornata]